MHAAPALGGAAQPGIQRRSACQSLDVRAIVCYLGHWSRFQVEPLVMASARSAPTPRKGDAARATTATSSSARASMRRRSSVRDVMQQDARYAFSAHVAPWWRNAWRSENECAALVRLASPVVTSATRTPCHPRVLGVWAAWAAFGPSSPTYACSCLTRSVPCCSRDPQRAAGQSRVCSVQCAQIHPARLVPRTRLE